MAEKVASRGVEVPRTMVGYGWFVDPFLRAAAATLLPQSEQQLRERVNALYIVDTPETKALLDCVIDGAVARAERRYVVLSHALSTRTTPTLPGTAAQLANRSRTVPLTQAAACELAVAS